MAKKPPVIDREGYLIFMDRAGGALGQGLRVQLLPAIFFTCCVMLVSRMMQGPSAYAGLGDLFYMSDSQTTSDFYFYYKSIAIYACTICTVAFFGYRAVTGAFWIRRDKLYLPLLAYLVLVFLSFLISGYRRIAWFGTDGLYGGAAVILCCGFMFFYIFNSVTNERCVKWFLWPLTVCVALASILGVTQWAGHDFFRTAAGQKLLVPNIETVSGIMSWDLIDSFAEQGKTALEFVFETAVYQTVGNPNYVALYTPLVLPLFAFLFFRERGLSARRIIWAAVFGLILFNLFASQSFGAIVGAVFALLAGVVLAGRRLFSRIKPKLVLVAIVAGCVFLNFQTLAGDTAKNILESIGEDRVPEVIGEMAEGTVAASDLEYYKRPTLSAHKLDSIVTEKDRIEITVDGEPFVVTGDPASLSAAPDYVAVSIEEQEDGNIAITLQLEAENRIWRFEQTPEGYRFVNDIGKLVRLRHVDHVGNDERLYLGTGRVYIWSRTLPLLKEAILLGRGSDTFMLYFPQDDYVGKYNGSWDLRAIVDKPHNLYLSIAFGSGILSLVAFLTLVCLYLTQSFRLYRRQGGIEDTVSTSSPLADTVGRGIFAGVCGFLASGMFYDGVTSVMPLFWGLLGLGAACNFLNKTPKQISRSDSTIQKTKGGQAGRKR